MSSRPSQKKALKKYAGSRAGRTKERQAGMSKVSKKSMAYKKALLADLMDDLPYPAQSQMIPRGFVGSRGDAKFLDTAITTYAVNTTGSITHISPVPQGTTVNTREGKAFRCTSVNIRGSVFADTAAIQQIYAGYLVWDYQPNKAAISAATTIPLIFNAINSTSFPNRENNERFLIVKKYYGNLIGNTTTPATGMESEAIDDYVRLPIDANVLCTTADTTGEIGNTIQGALYWVTMGNQAAGTADGQFNVGFRLNFTEKMT